MKNAFIKIAVCFAVIMFAISCKEKPTDSTNSGVSDMSSGDDFTIIKLDKTTSSIKKEAVYKFYVSPPDSSTTVTMSKVEVDQGSAIQGIILNPEDFILTPDLKDGITLTLTLSLSASGIEKFKDAQEATEIRYRAELDFKTSGQIKKMPISISVIPVHVTTKTEVENMIKALKTITVTEVAGIAVSFDFSQFTLSETSFPITANEGSVSGQNFHIKNAGDTIGDSIALSLQKEYSNLGLSYLYEENKAYHYIDEKNIEIPFRFKIDSKYALEDSAAFITTSGIMIKLTLQNNKWIVN